MRLHMASLIALLAFSFHARAELCTFTLVEDDLTLNVNVAGLVNADLNTTFGGTIVADTMVDSTPQPNTNIDYFELTSNSDIYIGGVSIFVPVGGGLLGNLNFSLVDVGATFADGFITDVTTPSNNAPGAFDLGGNTLSLNQGSVAISGTILGTAINESLDLTADPVEFAIPSPVPGTITNCIDWYYTSIDVPISITDTLDVDLGGTVLPVVFTITFHVQGTSPCPYCVPEFGSVGLIGMAGAGLIGGLTMHRRCKGR